MGNKHSSKITYETRFDTTITWQSKHEIQGCIFSNPIDYEIEIFNHNALPECYHNKVDQLIQITDPYLALCVQYNFIDIMCIHRQVEYDIDVDYNLDMIYCKNIMVRDEHCTNCKIEYIPKSIYIRYARDPCRNEIIMALLIGKTFMYGGCSSLQAFNSPLGDLSIMHIVKDFL